MKNTFEQDELIQNWIVTHITMIGEACRSLPDDFQARYAEILWADIIGMRNILVHHYFGIDLGSGLGSGGTRFTRVEVEYSGSSRPIG